MEAAACHITACLPEYIGKDFQSPRAQSVISIHKGDQCPLCQIKTGIPCCRNTFILHSDNADIFIGFFQFHAYFASTIRGSVIDDDDFQLLIRLVFDTLDAASQIAFAVIDRNDHTDQR